MKNIEITQTTQSGQKISLQIQAAGEKGFEVVLTLTDDIRNEATAFLAPEEVNQLTEILEEFYNWISDNSKTTEP